MKIIGVLGAGSMGSGIAQIAASNGCKVLLFDTNPKALISAIERLKKILNRLVEKQKINEDTKYKIIGLTLETRPDYINDTELKKMRALGTTRVQLGIQHTDNKILNKRIYYYYFIV